ncbi:TPA: lipid hydroperoxide peroxidase, partial [Streptococcus agalactiae]
EHNKVTYTEYVDNVNSDVDYEAAINAAKILP